MKDISIVIPCYRSEKTIEKVVEDCIYTIKKRKNTFEIVLVNDCSPDKVWDVIKRLKSKYPNVIKGIDLAKNFGQHAALMAGLRETDGKIVVTMDDDGQTDPKQMYKLIDKVNEGHDVAVAKYPETKENLFRRAGSELNRCMANSLVNQPKDVKDASYRAIKKYIVDEMVKYDKPFPYLAGLLYRVTQDVVPVEIEHLNRTEGVSGYSLKKLVGLVMNGFTAFSVKPLRIATYLGFILAFVGFIYALYLIIRKLVSPEIVVLGYSSLMSSILFIGGCLMVFLGLIGEYIGRIYICINNSPQYVVKEKLVESKPKKK